MVKKILFALLLALPLMASAQLGSGQWKIHPYFVGSSATNCIDAGNKVYYVSKGSLYSFDKSTQVSDVLDKNGMLNDDNITQIYYNYDKEYLVVTYKDCNIDIIKGDGSVVNLPDIKDVVLPKEKIINDVTFDEGKAYIATSFGYVVMDDATFNIVESRNFDANITSVAIIGDTKVMSIGNLFYYSGKDEQIEKVWSYKTFTHTLGGGRIYPINDSKFFFTNSSSLQVATVGHGTNTAGADTCSFTFTSVVAAVPVTLQPTPSGFVASFFSKNYYYTFDQSGGNAVKNTGNELYTTQEEGNWWVFGANGLAHIENGEKGEYTKANGISISANAYWSTYDPLQQRILLCRTTDNFVLVNANNGAVTEVNSYDGNSWKTITPVGAPNNQANSWIVASPNEPNTYFYSCRTTSGVCKVKNDTVVARYTYQNSPINNRAVALRFDSNGNLWMGQTRDTNKNIDAVAITPENQLLTVVDSTKFVTNNMGGACYSAGFKRFTFDIGAGDTKVFASGDWGYNVVIWTNNDDLSLKQFKTFSSFLDQDSKDYSSNNWIFIKADNEGMIWMGSVDGVISFNPTEAFNDDFRINRINVTRNEGEDTQEVLLEGTQVNTIGVDGMNRKWLGTNTSGVYFVSPDGSEIYNHFDTSNSPLPSNQIYSVCCNPNTNAALIVTANGVVEYFPDITPSEANYDNVYAYPSPVEPDFTGLITIKGLMVNSNVVITDVDGNVVYTTTSDGGVALWNGCDANGDRMKTGIYNVYASQSEPDVTAAPVTTIAIIK